MSCACNSFVLDFFFPYGFFLQVSFAGLFCGCLFIFFYVFCVQLFCLNLFCKSVSLVRLFVSLLGLFCRSLLRIFFYLYTSVVRNSFFFPFCFYIHLVLWVSLLSFLCWSLLTSTRLFWILNLSFVSRSLLISASILVGLSCGFLLGALFAFMWFYG